MILKSSFSNMVTLENDYLRVSIRNKGAEITSVYNKISKLEHVWQADPSVWPWHAPNLFPVIGGCIDNQIRVDGMPYPMSRHGFARNSEFVLLEGSDRHAEFSLGYSEETLKAYPFRFQFQLLYYLDDHRLHVTFKVINEDIRDIYFSVGAHPAFNVPFHPAEKFEEYYLEFEHDEPLDTHLISPEGFFNGEKETVDTEGRLLPLTRSLFARDALVLKNIRSRKVWLRSRTRSQHVEVTFPHFDYLGIWSKPGADFICIEPWMGCADSAGNLTDVSRKEGIRKLEKGHVFEAEYSIGVYQS
ncbi:MAG TPA: aldose 1-epimerase family protein [Sphingobacteriaceae bacterium]